MFRKIKNENGIALIMVLVLLLVVGGLTAALLNFGAFNIRFGVSEADRAKAFYAADAGVEYTRNWLREGGLNIIIDSDDPESINVIDNEEEFQDNHYFDIEVESYNDNKITFISTGRIENRTESEIKFSYDINPGESLEDIAYIGAGDGEVSEHVEFKGDQDELTEDNMHITQELGSWYEFLSKETFDLEKDDNSIETQDGYKTYGRLPFDPDNDDPDELEKPDDFAEFVITPDDEYITEYDEEKDEHYYPYYKKTNGSNEIYGTNYPYYGDSKSEDTLPFQLSNESRFNSQDAVEGLSDSHMFFSTEELVFDFDVKIGGGGKAVISDSILIIDGSFNTTGGIHLKDSIVLVRDKAEFGAALELERSLIVTFDEFTPEDSKAMVIGSPSVDFTAQPDYSRWSGIQQIIDSGGTPGYTYNKDWRQVR